MRISVIGTGYLGAVHAACMAELGHDVLGIDTDLEKIDALSNGRAPFFEPGLPDLLRDNVAAGRLRFSTSLKDAAAFGDIHFICVGTPQLAGSDAADLTYVDAVVTGLAPHLTRPCLIVGKSTVPVGTAVRLSALLATLSPTPDARLAWNPEFLREGFAVQDTLTPDRIVVGVAAANDDAALRELYRPMLEAGTPYLQTDLPTAELVKVSANAFLATKISFINAIAEICEVAGADVVKLAEAIGHDDRIGKKFLRSGVGFGGGCLGKDIRAFRARADELGVGSSLAFLRAVDDVNTPRRRVKTVDMAREMVGGDLTGRRIAVLGAAFKPNSDDVRDSPALHVAAAMHAGGAHVRVHDPEAIENARAQRPALDYTDEVDKAVEGAELVVHLTEWDDYRALDPATLTGLAASPKLLDGRNALDVDKWRAAGWTVRALGRSI